LYFTYIDWPTGVVRSLEIFEVNILRWIDQSECVKILENFILHLQIGKSKSVKNLFFFKSVLKIMYFIII